MNNFILKKNLLFSDHRMLFQGNLVLHLSFHVPFNFRSSERTVFIIWSSYIYPNDEIKGQFRRTSD